MTKLGIAIVGLGMAVTPHAKSLLDLSDGAEVAGAFSPTEERRRAFAERFPFRVTDDLDELITDPAVDAVMVLTPPNTHLDLVRRAAGAGKHVLLEKPLEISTDRAQALVDACRTAGVRLGIVLQHRYRPAGRRLREILDSGRLGRLVGASADILNWRPQSYYDQPGRGTKARDGGGVLLTQAIHTLDLLIHLAGLPEEVAGFAATSLVHRMETEDLAGAALRFAGGAIGTIDATTAAYPGYPERIALICEHGTASIEGARLKVAYQDGDAEDLVPEEEVGGSGADPMAFPHTQHLALIRDFLEAVRADRDPPISGEEALKVHLLIDALLRSAAERGFVRVSSSETASAPSDRVPAS